MRTEKINVEVILFCLFLLFLNQPSESSPSFKNCISEQDCNSKSREARDQYFNRGNDNTSEGLYDEAISNYIKTLELDPTFKEAYLQKCIIYTNYKKLYDEAIKDCSEALNIDQDFKSAYFIRGLTYNFKKSYDDAIKDFSKVVALDPNDKLSYFHRGFSYHKKRMFDLAISDFSKVIQLDPNYRDGFFQRGITYATRGFYDEAISDFTKALEIDPAFGAAHQSLDLAVRMKSHKK